MADTNTENNDTGNENETANTGDNATALLREKLCDSEARAALHAAGGDVELLLPHVRDVMRVEDDGKSVRITCTLGDEAVSPGDYVAALRARDGFAKAFTPNTPARDGDDNGDAENATAAASVRGSGASEQGSPAIGSIDAGNPLALGNALVDIATGKVSITL